MTKYIKKPETIENESTYKVWYKRREPLCMKPI
jgi:hypothetical protein